jgi:hypothetical protein
MRFAMKFEYPTYTDILPSTGKSIEYRPFTSKEEKNFLLSTQTKKSQDIVNAVYKLVDSCTSGRASEMTYYDVEYMYLKARGKSLGEEVELIGTCDACSTQTPFAVHIDDVQVTGKVGTSKIKIDEIGVGIELSHPGIKAVTVLENTEEDDEDRFLAESIKKIWTDDEVFDDLSFDDKLQFIEGLTPKNRKLLSQYMADMPLVNLKGGFTCSGCGKNHTVVLVGLDNFFV